MLFMKDKKQAAGKGRRPGPKEEKRPVQKPGKPGQPAHNRPAPEQAGRRPEEARPVRRPAPEAQKEPVSEEKKSVRRPAPEERRTRRPASEEKKPARRPAPEERKPRRPASEERKPARRPAPEERKPRRPASEERKPARRPAPEERRPRRPAPEERRVPRRPVPEEARRRPVQRPAPEEQLSQRQTVQRPALEQSPESQNAEAPVAVAERPAESIQEERVFQVDQPVRQVPTGARKPRPSRPAVTGDPTKSRKKTGSVPQGTSYHRSTPKPKKGIQAFFQKQSAKFYKDPDQQAAAARARQAAREKQKEKLKKLAEKFDTPAIVYTEPKPFNRNRLLVQMISVLAVACAFVMGLSIFFKVKVIKVSGAETYSPYAIEQASGILKGDNLLTFGRARASGQITANLPYVESVRIGIKLPDTVNIEVREVDVAYSVKSGDGDWWLVTSEGKVVEQIPGALAKNYTKILGVELEKPVANEMGLPVEQVPDATASTEETIANPVTVTGAQRFSAALQILQALEDNDIVGDAATVDVSNLEKIELWYGQRYQVNLGDASRLDYKIACMYDAILQMSDYQTGMLDVSFTKKQDQVIYTPFV